MADIVVYEKDEKQFYQEVRDTIITARDKAYNSANKVMTYTYRNVDRRVVVQEQKGNSRADYGEYYHKTPFIASWG